MDIHFSLQYDGRQLELYDNVGQWCPPSEEFIYLLFWVMMGSGIFAALFLLVGVVGFRDRPNNKTLRLILRLIAAITGVVLGGVIGGYVTMQCLN